MNATSPNHSLLRRGLPWLLVLALLVAIGYGQDKNIAPNDTADGRAKNRRIEFLVKVR